MAPATTKSISHGRTVRRAESMALLYAAPRWPHGRRRGARAGSKRTAVGLTPARVYPSCTWTPLHAHASPIRCTATRTVRRLRLRLRRRTVLVAVHRIGLACAWRGVHVQLG